MAKDIRRVVTVQNQDSYSVIESDREIDNLDQFISGVAEARSYNVWATHEMPAPLDENDPQIPKLQPPKNGTIFRIIDLPPVSSYQDRDEITFNFQKLSPPQKRTQASFMTRWGDLMYCIILEGEVTFVLDTAEVLLKQGDVLVDRGSHHGWINHTDANCRIALVLIDAK
jgi:hypothetical protein